MPLSLIVDTLTNGALRLARADERRRAFREAARLAEMRADLAVELAPLGRLTYGVDRASIAHEIAMDLRAMAEAVR